MYGTTKKFLDYFNLKNLNELPSLAELRDLNEIGKELELDLSEIPGLEMESATDEAAEASAESDAETEAETEAVAEAPLSEDVAAAPESADSDNVATLH